MKKPYMAAIVVILIVVIIVAVYAAGPLNDRGSNDEIRMMPAVNDYYEYSEVDDILGENTTRFTITAIDETTGLLTVECVLDGVLISTYTQTAEEFYTGVIAYDIELLDLLEENVKVKTPFGVRLCNVYGIETDDLYVKQYVGIDNGVNYISESYVSMLGVSATSVSTLTSTTLFGPAPEVNDVPEDETPSEGDNESDEGSDVPEDNGNDSGDGEGDNESEEIPETDDTPSEGDNESGDESDVPEESEVPEADE